MSSKGRYRGFVEDYRQGRVGDEKPNEPKLAGKRREYLRDYIRWLAPHRSGIAVVFALALVAAGLSMVEPLFMRYIVDRVLLNRNLDPAGRLPLLNAAGALFLALVIASNLLNALREYRQKLLNTRVML